MFYAIGRVKSRSQPDCPTTSRPPAALGVRSFLVVYVGLRLEVTIARILVYKWAALPVIGTQIQQCLGGPMMDSPKMCPQPRCHRQESVEVRRLDEDPKSVDLPLGNNPRDRLTLCPRGIVNARAPTAGASCCSGRTTLVSASYPCRQHELVPVWRLPALKKGRKRSLRNVAPRLHHFLS